MLDEYGHIQTHSRNNPPITEPQISGRAEKTPKDKINTLFEKFLESKGILSICLLQSQTIPSKATAKQERMAFQDIQKEHRHELKTFKEFIQLVQQQTTWKLKHGHTRTGVLAKITTFCNKDVFRMEQKETTKIK